MSDVTGQQVAQFLGQSDVPSVVALAEEHAEIITAMVRAYTRGGGFAESGEPNDELEAVIVTATARLVANPEQVPYDAGSISIRGGFHGFNLAETMVLNRYRRRAA